MGNCRLFIACARTVDRQPFGYQVPEVPHERVQGRGGRDGEPGRSPLCIAAKWSFAGGVESKLEGNWQMVRAELAGEPAPELVTTNMMLTLAVGGYEVRYGGVVSDRGTFLVEASTEQRTLLLTGVEGPNAERTIPCIYQLTGDRLRVCYGLDGTMPEGFSTRLGEARYLATYRRATLPEAG